MRKPRCLAEMMQEIQIGKFAAHYRLPPSALAARRRLDQVMKLMLDEMFERALGAAGLPEDGEICLSKIRAPIRLHLARSDASMAEEWSRELAEEILRAMRDRRAVFYRSRRHALMDLAVSVARGDLSRAWAWRQLGLWRASDAASEGEAIYELVSAVSSDPVAVIPALNALAEAGCLERIARRFNSRHWMALATAALNEAGAMELVKEGADKPSSRALRDAMRVINSSRLLPAITASQSLAGESLEACRAAAALVALEAEPARLRSESAARHGQPHRQRYPFGDHGSQPVFARNVGSGPRGRPKSRKRNSARRCAAEGAGWGDGINDGAKGNGGNGY